ncbi:MAG: FG-GAP-like repeat-containing protein [Bacteroidota bacterium]
MYKSLITTLPCLFLTLSLMGQNQYENLSEYARINTTGPNISINVVDADGDGWEDIYVGRIGEANQFFLNNGDGTFNEIAAIVGIADEGLSYTSIWGDLDNDGDADLYVGNRNSANRLYRNEGNAVFTDITEEAGVGYESAPRSLLLSDVDRDGWLDIYVANLDDENVLYRNNGDGTFTDTTQMSGALDNQLSLGAIFFDYDQDGDSDLYLTHDNNQPNILYQNDGNGQFTDVSESSNTDYAGFGMGVATGDVNGDGWLDIYITNLYDNILLLNDGDGTFTDITSTAGINDYGMGWGTTFLDFDNDGLLDLYTVNDSYFSPYDNVLYRNQGDNTFTIVSDDQPESSPYGAYGTATLDLNKDGRLDLLVSNTGANGGNQYFENVVGSPGKWLQIKLRGTISNRDAIGAQLTLYAGDQLWRQEVYGGSGYASQNSLWQHFGLGEVEQLDSMHIRWPNGMEETFYDIPAEQFLVYTEGSGWTSTSTLDPQQLATLYPNPVADSEAYLQFSSETTGSARVVLLNAQGQIVREVYEGKLVVNQQLPIPVAELPAGVYWLRLQAEERTTAWQLVKP